MISIRVIKLYAVLTRHITAKVTDSATHDYTEPITDSDSTNFVSNGWPVQFGVSESQWLIPDDLMVDDWSHLQAEADTNLRQFAELTPGWI